jgi:hypothetical protein
MHLQQNKTVSSVPLSSDIKRGATFLGTREKRIVRDSDEKNDHLIFAQEISSRLEKQRDQMQVTIGTSDREGTRSKLKITRTIFGQSAEFTHPISGFNLCTSNQQLIHHFCVTFITGNVEGSRSRLKTSQTLINRQRNTNMSFGLNICAIFQQVIDQSHVTSITSIVEGSLSILIISQTHSHQI